MSLEALVFMRLEALVFMGWTLSSVRRGEDWLGEDQFERSMTLAATWCEVEASNFGVQGFGFRVES